MCGQLAMMPGYIGDFIVDRLKTALINEIVDYLNMGSFSNSEIRLFRRDLKRMSKPGLSMILSMLINLY